MTSGCHRVDPAWFQRLKLKCDEALSNLAFKLNLRHYSKLGEVDDSEYDAVDDVDLVGTLHP